MSSEKPFDCLREYKRLKEIESELAKERQATSTGGKKPQLTANLPEAEKGEARDKAAATAGLKPRTAEKGLAVLNREF